MLIWALFQNLFRLGTPGILNDEPIYARAGWRYVHGDVAAPLHITQGIAPFNIDNFEHPPLVKWLFGLAELTTGHESVLADRIVAAIATILTGVVLLVWIGRVAGRWTGLLACALAVLLPEMIPSATERFGRYGFLDPVAEFFVVVYLLLMWEWFASERRRAWLFAAASGIAIGCAAASKENGFLAAVAPILVLWALATRRGPYLLAQRLGQVGVAVLASLGTFLLTYAPFSSPFQRIRYLIEFQTQHSDNGHLVGLAGRVTQHPPWWANLWFAAHGMGTAVTIFVLGFAALACLLHRDRLVVFCLAALAGPVIFHCFIAGVALGSYWTLWMPPLFVLAALGVAEGARRLQAVHVPRPVQVGAVVLMLLIPLLACLSLTRRTAAITVQGPEVLPSVLARHGLTGPLLSSGIYGAQYNIYLPDLPVRMSPSKSLAAVDAVVIGAPQCRLEPDNRTTRSIVAVNLAAHRLRRIHVDSAITVYAVTRKLIMPSPAEIATQSPTNLAAGC